MYTHTRQAHTGKVGGAERRAEEEELRRYAIAHEDVLGFFLRIGLKAYTHTNHSPSPKLYLYKFIIANLI